MSQSPALQIRNLTKIIGKKTIVDGLSFDVQKGEVLGLLGPNGAGKTTTIRMLVGLMSISRGQVLINGIDVAKQFSAAMQHVGAIVENPEFYNFLTGYQNLKHFANLSKEVPRARIAEAAQQTGLERRLRDKVKTYSLGMRQRLGLAQALLRKPNVVILDEPTNGLDPAGIRNLRDYLRRLAEQEDIAVLVSSHLLSEMELMCDRVVIIQSGRLIDIRAVRETSEKSDAMQLFSIEVDNVPQAAKLIGDRYPDLRVAQGNGIIELHITRQQVPDVLHALETGGIGVYGVQGMTKTLEETFLEITGGESHL